MSVTRTIGQASRYQPVTRRPDHLEIEKRTLEFWQQGRHFERLVERNRGVGRPGANPRRFKFLDGPITANGPMGVHHAWGRTVKDLVQRYKAMQGYDQRFQNGFDCQGLWVEVEVEKELGFKSKKDIESYGIDKFVEKCKERVRKYSAMQTEQSIRLGQWMDWENSYFTMS
ncbi:MAG: class I tRNA ligase family protein, partial [candidate division WOR-3 bacterium]